MKITGIICEYNPFHYGHKHHIEETKKLTGCDVLICVMSGNFVQRGEPAITNKWDRARCALEQGCDIVIELPYPMVMQSAQYFAKGAVDLLALAGVDTIVFGSETNDIEILKKIADIDSNQYRDLMKDGLSVVKAYEIIYGTLNANDILGINYIKACKEHNITPLCIKRTNHYHEENVNQTSFSSATAIRNAIYSGNNVESFTPMKQLDHSFQLKNYYPLIQHLLFTLSPETLASIFLMDEGIEKLMIEKAKKHMDFDSFLEACISKRYTKSKIRRTLIHLLTHTTKETMNNLPQCNYLRILGFNDNGRTYMHQLKKEGIEIASRFSQIPLTYRQMELKAAQTIAYVLNDTKEDYINMELQSPIMLKTKE